MTTALSITVPVAGLSEKIVREAFGLSVAELHALMGDKIGSPRDYSMPIHEPAAIFTPAGVRNLAAHLGREVQVIDQAARAQDGYQREPEEMQP